MEIKRWYFTEAQKAWDEFEQKENKRKANLTDEERAREKEKNKKEIDKIVRQATEMASKKVMSIKRQETFRKR